MNHDPLARLCNVGLLAVALYATAMLGSAQPKTAQAEAKQEPIIQIQKEIVIATPTPTLPLLDEPAAVQVVAPAVAAPAPVAAPVVQEQPAVQEQPVVNVTAANEGIHPAEHQLEPARAITIDPQPAEPQAGDTLIQANDQQSWTNATSGEGTKPSRAWKP